MTLPLLLFLPRVLPVACQYLVPIIVVAVVAFTPAECSAEVRRLLRLCKRKTKFVGVTKRSNKNETPHSKTFRHYFHCSMMHSIQRMMLAAG